MMSLKLATWNVLADGLAQNGGFLDDRGEPVPAEVLDFDRRFAIHTGIARQILADADVLALQEVNHADRWLVMLSSLGFDCRFRAKADAPAARYGAPPDGVLLACRQARFETSWDAVEQKDPTSLTCALRDRATGATVTVMCAHFKAKAGEANEARRACQAAAVARRGPDLLLADCNAEARCGNRHADVLRAEGYASAVNTKECTVLTTTRKLRRTPSGNLELKFKAIDQIWVSVGGGGHFDVTDLVQLDTGVANATCPNAEVPSDHLPLIVTLHLTLPAAPTGEMTTLV